MLLCFAPLQFVVSGIILPRLLAFPYFYKCWSGSHPVEVSGLEYDQESFWLQSTALEVPGSSVSGPTEDLCIPSEVLDSQLYP